MILTVRQSLKHLSREDIASLQILSRAAKDLTNEALYIIRQEFFTSKKYLGYREVQKRLQAESKAYRLLQSNMAQQVLRKVDSNFSSFFGALKAREKNSIYQRIRLPRYLPKLGFSQLVIQMVIITNGKFRVPYSREFAKSHEKIYIKVPPILLDKKINEIKIIPKNNATAFDAFYSYTACEEQSSTLDMEKAMAIDIGITNLCTCVTTEGECFIVDGKRLKSYNQWFNKEIVRLREISQKQGHSSFTRQENKLFNRRNNQVNDILSKAAKYIVEYAVHHKIGCIVLGYSKLLYKRELIKEDFIGIPFEKLKLKLEYLSKQRGIILKLQEESFTSMASALDGDFVPALGERGERADFSGERAKRGLYISKENREINADLNAAINILKKSNVVAEEKIAWLCSRGVLSTPARIRVLD